MNNGLLNGVSRPGAPVAPALPGLPPIVGFLGDSITINGGTKTGVGTFNGTALAWQMWASMLSGGRFIVGHIGGLSGMTTEQIENRYLPAFLADNANPLGVRHGYCVVMAGTNDISPLSLAHTKRALISIWSQLAAAGVEPILCTLTPRTQAITVTRINQFIRFYALVNGWKLIDFANEATLVDASGDGTWIDAYTSDGTHPLQNGAKAMGQFVANRFAEWGMLTVDPLLSCAQADGANLNSTTNGMMLTDTNADGVPDGWSITGTGGTSALSAATTPGVGNKALITKGSATTTWTSTGTSASRGDLVYYAMRVQTALLLEGTSAVQIQALNANPNFMLFLTNYNIPAGSVLSGLVRMTSTATVQQGVSLTIGDASTATVTQPTLYNLTTLIGA